VPIFGLTFYLMIAVVMIVVSGVFAVWRGSFGVAWVTVLFIAGMTLALFPNLQVMLSPEQPTLAAQLEDKAITLQQAGVKEVTLIAGQLCLKAERSLCQTTTLERTNLYATTEPFVLRASVDEQRLSLGEAKAFVTQVFDAAVAFRQESQQNQSSWQ
jgi:hypothetical protein